MLALQSNTDAILVAVPMVGVMFAVLFRLDESLSRGRKPMEQGHPLSDWDKDGLPVCVEPDGKLLQREQSNANMNRMNKKPRRARVARVFVEYGFEVVLEDRRALPADIASFEKGQN